MFKATLNSVNISPTQIIHVNKLKGEFRKNNVWLWSEIIKRLLRVYKCALQMNYTSPTQNITL